ncbi:MAG: Hsp70 family protein [Planctomycetes bacterium]|nr:Hsp70 family protein [Planctomycetota bacterium]
MSGTKKPEPPSSGSHERPGRSTPRPPAGPAPADETRDTDPFANEDPIDAVLPVASTSGDDDFDALGFDTSFGITPSAPPGATLTLTDQDETPPAGVFLGEDVQVLSAHTIGRALAEADGARPDEPLPDMAALQVGLVGIDIGASAAVVARFNDDGQHEIVPNQEDERVTPMQVFFDEDGERLVGREARSMAASAPGRAVVDLKEMIADPFFRLSAGGADGEVDSQAVLGMVLGRLLEDVARQAGAPPTHVALAAPAWFAETQRETLRRAVERAGVTLVGITDEALAAAVPYSLRLPDLNPRLALVFDLGHAALGVGVVRCAGGDIQVLAQDARRELGSARWDLLIAQEAARKFKQAHTFDPMQDKGGAIDLRLRAEDAKRELSRRTQTTLTVSARGKVLKVGFTRAGLEDAAKDLVQKSLAFAREVRDQAGVGSWAEVDALIMTGGGSRTPVVRAALAAEVGRAAERGIGAEEGVAIGALYWGTLERHRQAR